MTADNLNRDWCDLRFRINNNTASQFERDRYQWVTQQLVAPELARVRQALREVQPQIDAAIARRRAAQARQRPTPRRR